MFPCSYIGKDKIYTTKKKIHSSDIYKTVSQQTLTLHLLYSAKPLLSSDVINGFFYSKPNIQ